MPPATLRLLAAIAAAAGAALVLRFYGIEPARLGQACQEQSAPWWCVPRQAIVDVLYFRVWGVVALAVALYGLWRGSARAAATGALLGAAGLVLYNADFSAVALLLGLLRAVRPATA